MTALKKAWRSVLRHRGKTLTALAVSVSLSLFLCLFAGNLEQNRVEWNRLSDGADIRIQITSSNGQQKTGLLIDDDRLEKIEATGLAERGLYTARALFTDSEDQEENVRSPHFNGHILAAYTADTPLTEAGEDNISYFSGYDSSLFGGSEAVCLLQEDFLNSRGLQLGDSYHVRLNTLKEGGEVYPAGEAEFKIAGTFRESGSGFANAVAVCSYDTLKAALSQFNLHIWPSSAWLKVKDPTQLNRIKEAMKEANITSVLPQAYLFSTQGSAAVINDRKFILRAEPLERNIRLLQSLYPLFFAAVAVIAFLVSYLLAQSRRDEIAVCRSLGESRTGVFLQFFWESTVVCLSGAVLGFGAAALLSGISPGMLALPLLGYLAAYLLGAAAAILLLNRTNVIQVLTTLD